MSEIAYVHDIYMKIINHPYLRKQQHSLSNVSLETFSSRYGDSLNFTQEWLLLAGKRGDVFHCYLFQLQNTPAKFGLGCHRLRLFLPTQLAIVPMVVRSISHLKREILLFDDYLPPQRCCYVVRGRELYRIFPLLPLFRKPMQRVLHQTEIDQFFPKQFHPQMENPEHSSTQSNENVFHW